MKNLKLLYLVNIFDLEFDFLKDITSSNTPKTKLQLLFVNIDCLNSRDECFFVS